MAKPIERIEDLLKGSIDQAGYELWNIEYQKEGKQWFLRIFIDHPDGVSLEGCAEISRLIDPILESNDIIPQEYILEVSSPGIDRPLNKPEHFIRYIGEKIQVQLFEAVAGKKKLKGQLETASSDGFQILLDSEESVTLSYQQVAKAKVAS